MHFIFYHLFVTLVRTSFLPSLCHTSMYFMFCHLFVTLVRTSSSTSLYALPAWFGQLTQLDIDRINGLFRKAHRWQLSGHVYTVEQLAGAADAGLFKAIASNPNHSLYQILPPFRPNQYSLRKRGHLFQLLINDLRKYSFSNRITNMWNSLPDSVVMADTVN